MSAAALTLAGQFRFSALGCLLAAGTVWGGGFKALAEPDPRCAKASS